MAAFETQTRREDDLTVLTVRGQVTAAEILEGLEAFYAGTPTLNLLWDLQGADLSPLTSEDLQLIMNRAKQHAPRRAGGRTALVIGSDFAFGMSRMYEILSDVHGHPVAHATFRTLEEGLAWLRGEAGSA